MPANSGSKSNETKAASNKGLLEATSAEEERGEGVLDVDRNAAANVGGTEGAPSEEPSLDSQLLSQNDQGKVPGHDEEAQLPALPREGGKEPGNARDSGGDIAVTDDQVYSSPEAGMARQDAVELSIPAEERANLQPTQSKWQLEEAGGATEEPPEVKEPKSASEKPEQLPIPSGDLQSHQLQQEEEGQGGSGHREAGEAAKTTRKEEGPLDTIAQTKASPEAEGSPGGEPSPLGLEVLEPAIEQAAIKELPRKKPEKSKGVDKTGIPKPPVSAIIGSKKSKTAGKTTTPIPPTAVSKASPATTANKQTSKPKPKPVAKVPSAKPKPFSEGLAEGKEKQSGGVEIRRDPGEEADRAMKLLKKEQQARAELEDMLLRIEKHFKTEQELRKKAEQEAEQARAAEEALRSELEEERQRSDEALMDMEEARQELDAREQAMLEEQKRFDEEAGMLRKAADDATSALRRAEGMGRAMEAQERSRVEMQLHQRISILQAELDSVRSELMHRTASLSDEMMRWRHQAEHSAAAVMEAKKEVINRKKELDIARNKMDDILDKLAFTREKGIELTSAIDQQLHRGQPPAWMFTGMMPHGFHPPPPGHASAWRPPMPQLAPPRGVMMPAPGAMHYLHNPSAALPPIHAPSPASHPPHQSNPSPGKTSSQIHLPPINDRSPKAAGGESKEKVQGARGQAQKPRGAKPKPRKEADRWAEAQRDHARLSYAASRLG